MYAIPYVFISKFDPDVPPSDKTNPFRYAYIGVGHPTVPNLTIRPYFKNPHSLNGIIYDDCKRFVPCQGTVFGFLSDLSRSLKRKVQRGDLEKGYGRLTELFSDMYLFCELPVGKTLMENTRVKFVDVQNYSADFPDEKSQRREAPVKPKLSYIGDMENVAAASTKKWLDVLKKY